MLHVGHGKRVGRIFGFPVRIDPTLIIIIGIFVLSGLRGGLGGLASQLIFFGCLVASVLWHELGHALAARHYRFTNIDIVLGGLGGVTRFHGRGGAPPDPKQGIVIAAAGPAAGLLLGALAWGVSLLLGPTTFYLDRALGALVLFGMVLNIANLVPIYPLDGGQIMRHLLTLRRPASAALRLSAQVSLGLLVVAAAALVFYSPTSIFLWFILILIAGENWRIIQPRGEQRG